MSQLLTSWKEIANHFGKGVRTVQRWEAKLGLPIHRPDSGAHNIVFAIPEELNLWVARLSHQRLQEEALPESSLLVRLKELELENSLLRQKIIALSGEQSPLNTAIQRSVN